MKAIILAAGHGKRLRPLTETTPKPLLPVNNKPLLSYQLQWLKRAGVREIVINLHHLAAQIKNYCGDGRRFGVSIRYSYEKELLETGGGIINALPLLGNEPFIVLNGDIYTDFPFQNLPKKLPPLTNAHLVLTPKPQQIGKGDFTFADGKITSRGNDYIYSGIAVLDPRLLAKFPKKKFSLREPLFEAVHNKQVSGQVWAGQWTDIGSINEYLKLNRNKDS
tara:strand:- start:1533 stop:2195 length:663 start_codon:yes stop_codon:yes gene_type:complete